MIAPRHPAERALARYLAGTDTPTERARLDAHLANCRECGDDVAFARVVERRARALDPEVAGPELLGRIRASAFQSGPKEPVWSTLARPGIGRRWTLAAAALLVLGAGLALLSRATPAAAGAMSGELRFTPALPLAGDSVSVVYRPAAILSTLDRLDLRAHYRTVMGVPSPWVRQSVVAHLVRGRDGAFHGALRLPDSAVYAAFAVEDSGAHHVDSNGGQLWELLTKGGNGRPRFEALEQQINDLYARNWERSLALSRQLTGVYPDQVRGWMLRLFYEQTMLSGRAVDSLKRIHRARLPLLDQRFSAGSIDPEELGAMVQYARTLDDSGRASRWLAALEKVPPRGLWGINQIIDPVATLLRSHPAIALGMLDSLWVANGSVHPGILTFGLAAAQASGDSAALLRWVDRVLTSGQGEPAQVITTLAAAPSLRAEELRRLRAVVAAGGQLDDGLRALDCNAAEYAPLQDDRRRRALAALGDALVASGDTRSGVDTLALATRMGWDVSLLRRASEAFLRVGDTSDARGMLAHIAADPATSNAFGDSVQARLGPSPDWLAAVTKAKEDLRAQLLARATSVGLPGIRLTASDGKTVTLRGLVNGHPTLVAFWDISCPHSVADLPVLERLTIRLQSLGYTVITIVNEPPSAALTRYIADHHLTFPMYRDSYHEAQLAFNQWGVPVYHVLDGSARLRYVKQPLSAVAAELESLAGGHSN